MAITQAALMAIVRPARQQLARANRNEDEKRESTTNDSSAGITPPSSTADPTPPPTHLDSTARISPSPSRNPTRTSSRTKRQRHQQLTTLDNTALLRSAIEAGSWCFLSGVDAAALRSMTNTGNP
jgi:hypothetical protein